MSKVVMLVKIFFFYILKPRLFSLFIKSLKNLAMFSLSDFDNLFKQFRLEKLPGCITITKKRG